MAPSRMVRFLSGTILSTSMDSMEPRPWQSGHIPRGELNEKSGGSRDREGGWVLRHGRCGEGIAAKDQEGEKEGKEQRRSRTEVFQGNLLVRQSKRGWFWDFFSWQQACQELERC